MAKANKKRPNKYSTFIMVCSPDEYIYNMCLNNNAHLKYRQDPKLTACLGSYRYFVSHSPHYSLIEYLRILNIVNITVACSVLKSISKSMNYNTYAASLGSYRYIVSHSPHDDSIGIPSILGHRECHSVLEWISKSMNYVILLILLLTDLRFFVILWLSSNCLAYNGLGLSKGTDSGFPNGCLVYRT
ncbi:hypothetical protein CEXT_579161 [Caerostris extrusa]|uniref:Uncharacterized protein n=1 Tax=Caerostris extrusa TaxID=172846 RepID=A0AAV4VZZ9_CAEEX|nr:hypothetical protein CEXT_579161 [Caerostris extrusa]